ncbi:hypothetical protein F5X99DRAFT_368967 [Biscogniauxia marginata]|nr:hypothetical protein F5X99DRAFT_368967 [Biscogniauxia marginata]
MPSWGLMGLMGVTASRHHFWNWLTLLACMGAVSYHFGIRCVGSLYFRIGLRRVVWSANFGSERVFSRLDCCVY